MTDLSHRLDRSIVIHATPQTVFRFFTDSTRWASWWGQGSTIDAREGGEVRIRYPDGTEVAGTILDMDVPTRLIFTYGYVSGSPIAVGASRVTIDLERHPAGTRLNLTHEFADAVVRDQHVQGWRYQFALFSNLVSDEVTVDAGKSVDAWFAAWAESNDEARLKSLTSVADASVRFRDRFGHTDGLADLIPHIAAAQRFMPGLRLERRGDIRQCQGTALADWVAVSPDGQERGGGTNVFTFDSTGRITAVTGFWAPPPGGGRA
jgi:uncharacterized protein YndB with AHSA1/START domain